jgi:hypothetical protein
MAFTNATKDTIEVLYGPDSTRAMAAALKAIAERVRTGELSREEAVRQAADISPKYAALLDTCIKIGIPAVALLVSIIALYLQYEGNRSSSLEANKLLDEVTKQTHLLKDMRGEVRNLPGAL